METLVAQNCECVNEAPAFSLISVAGQCFRWHLGLRDDSGEAEVQAAAAAATATPAFQVS